MKRCFLCDAANAGFSSRCVQCHTDIGKSDFDTLISATIKLAQHKSTHGENSMWGSMMKKMVPNASQVGPSTVRDIRNECLLFFHNWAGTIANDYSFRELESYLSSFIPESASPSVAHKYAIELITVIDNRAGIYRKYQERLRQEQLARAEQARAEEEQERLELERMNEPQPRVFNPEDL